MNKRVCRIGVLLMLPLFVFSGCGQKAAIPPITDGFTSHVAVEYREMLIEGDLTCGQDGAVAMDFTLPKSLYGVSLRWDGQEMSIALGGMHLAVPAEKVPQSALLCCLAGVLAADHEMDGTTDEGSVITGQVDGKAYELVCDAKTGFPLRLSMPEEELEATFTAFQLLESPAE